MRANVRSVLAVSVAATAIGLIWVGARLRGAMSRQSSEPVVVQPGPAQASEREREEVPVVVEQPGFVSQPIESGSQPEAPAAALAGLDEPRAGRNSAGTADSSQSGATWSVTGRIVGADGAASGAQVTLGLTTELSGGRRDSRELEASRTRGSARRGGDAQRKTDRTDSAGAFELRVPRAALTAQGSERFELRVRSPGRTARFEGVVDLSSDRQDVGEIWLHESGELLIEVRAADGSPVDGDKFLALVREAGGAQPAPGSDLETVLGFSNVRPNRATEIVDLPAGPVVVELLDRSRSTVALEHVFVRPGRSQKVVITYSGFDPEHRLWVRFQPPGSLEFLGADPVELSGNGIVARAPDFVGGGFAAFDELPNGRYTVALVSSLCELTSAEGYPSGPPVVLPIVGNASVALRVVDHQTGMPVESLVVTALPFSSGSRERGLIAEPAGLSALDALTSLPVATVDPQREEARSELAFCRGLVPGDHLLIVGAPSYQPAVVEVSGLRVQEERRLDVDLSAGVSLTGSVRAENGVLLGDCRVRLVRARRGAVQDLARALEAGEDLERWMRRYRAVGLPGRSTDVTESDGSFEIQRVPPGSFLLIAQDGERCFTAERIEVGLDPLAGQVLRLPETRLVSGVLSGARGAAESGPGWSEYEVLAYESGRPRDEELGSARPDSRGRFDLGPLPLRTVELVLRPRGQGFELRFGAATVRRGVDRSVPRYELELPAYGPIALDLELEGGAPAGIEVRWEACGQDASGVDGFASERLDARGHASTLAFGVPLRVSLRAADSSWAHQVAERWTPVLAELPSGRSARDLPSESNRQLAGGGAGDRLELRLELVHTAIDLLDEDGAPLVGQGVRWSFGDLPRSAAMQGVTDGSGRLELTLPAGEVWFERVPEGGAPVAEGVPARERGGQRVSVIWRKPVAGAALPAIRLPR